MGDKAKTGDSPVTEHQFKFKHIDAEEYLKSCDPNNWKEQDHYAIFGLSTVRFQATAAELKKAYRKLVLKHHPDKKQQAGHDDKSEAYYPCITKAWEILGDPEKRLAFDSVDPAISEMMDEVPDKSQVQKEHDFYKIMGNVFRKNAHWSTKSRVPQLGDENSEEHDVAEFYDFWYNFESNREYSYLDEEDKEKGEDRFERREIDKLNKANRKKRKSEEISRIRKLVDLAYAVDPRLKRFKEAAKQKKADEKLCKKQLVEDKKRAEQEAIEKERLAKEAEQKERDDAAREEGLRNKKEKAAARKAMAKCRKELSSFIEEKNYFETSGEEKITIMENIELMCSALDALQLRDLNKNLKMDVEKAKDIFTEEAKNVKARLRAEQNVSQEDSNACSSSDANSILTKNWHPEDVKLLVRGLRTFPAGTKDRWEVICTFIMQHSKTGKKYTAKDVVKRVKENEKAKVGEIVDSVKNAAKVDALANGDSSAFEVFNQEKKRAATVASAPSTRFDTPKNFVPDKNAAWTAAEQKLLEQGLKMYPQAIENRWDMIAEMVSTRDKEQCLKRYQAVVAAMRAKKAAAKK